MEIDKATMKELNAQAKEIAEEVVEEISREVYDETYREAYLDYLSTWNADKDDNLLPPNEGISEEADEVAMREATEKASFAHKIAMEAAYKVALDFLVREHTEE